MKFQTKELKYNIISKYPKGNKPNQTYEIMYQLNSKPTVFKIKMIYIIFENEKQYAFLDFDKYPHVGIMNNKDKDNFLKELAEFQKGGSYRKTHPIAYSNLDILKQKRKELQKQVGALDIEIKNIQKQEYEEKIKDLVDKVDLKSIDKSLKKICEAFEDKPYKLVHDGHSYNDHTFLFIDTTVNIPVVRITFINGRIYFDHLQDKDMVKYLD